MLMLSLGISLLLLATLILFFVFKQKKLQAMEGRDTQVTESDVDLDDDDETTKAISTINRLPILNSQQQIIGYNLSNKGRAFQADTLAALILFLGNEAYQRPDKMLVIQLDNDTLADESLHLLPAAAILFFPNLTQFESSQLETLQRLVSLGYRIAITPSPDQTLMSTIQFVVLDARMAQESLQNELALVRGKKLRVLASHVNKLETYRFLRSVGINLYQGFFFAEPEVLSVSSPNSQINNILSLIRMVSTRAEPDAIEKQFKHDPDLTFRMLKYMNSAALNLAHKITSIKVAIVMMGYNNLLRWLSVLLAASESVPAESREALYETGSTRGRCMELLADKVGLDKDEQDKAFMVGMFSLIPVMLQQPAEALLDDLNLPDDVMSTLIQNNGPFTSLYKLTMACERAEATTIGELCQYLALETDDVYQAHIDAGQWASELEA